MSALKMIVENLIMPLGLAPVSIHRVVEALGRSVLEVNGLAGERPES